MNPYDWQSHTPRIEVPRPALAKVTKTLGYGGSAVALGGRGMGKSVFLQQLCAALESEGELRVVATRRDLRGLGMLATGSIGVYVVRDVLGSSFLSRALHVTLSPLERSEVTGLTRPFTERGTALPQEVLDALQLAAGGIPSLVTFGLQQLWELPRDPVERDVADLFGVFLEEHEKYLHDLLRSVSDPRFSAAPRRVWERIRRDPGLLSREQLEDAFGPREGLLDLRLTDVLKLLQASGLVRFRSSSLVTSDPIIAYPIASLLNLPASPPPADLSTV